MLPAYQPLQKFQGAPKGRPGSGQDPFQLAIQSAQRLQGYQATPTQTKGAPITMPQIRSAGSPVSPVAIGDKPSPFISGKPPLPELGGDGVVGQYGTPPPRFISGAQSATGGSAIGGTVNAGAQAPGTPPAPPVGVPPASPSSRPNTAAGDLEFGGYDAAGNAIYSQAEKTRAVGPGPTGTDVYATRAAEHNAASSRWHGNITADDERAFDQYAASYKTRVGGVVPEIWDWLAAGRPQTTGDYYDDKALEYNYHARTQGLYYAPITRDDV